MIDRLPKRMARQRSYASLWRILAVGCLFAQGCSAFLHSGTQILSISAHTRAQSLPGRVTQLQPKNHGILTRPTTYIITKTEQHMSSSDDGGGGLRGILFSLLGVSLILLFVGTSFLPMMDSGGGSRDLSIADSVVTRQDAPGKLQNYEASPNDRLSRSSIQEKLNAVPVFYLVDKANAMSSNIYTSYQDASNAAATCSLTVKATTLDQVT
jgi:hypothetical protein